MSVAFYSNDLDAISRKVDPSLCQEANEAISVDEAYELDKCIQWIKYNGFFKIALQFPDNLLNVAASIALKLQESTGKEIFVLGDTSYGSCCVDEIAAEHASADGIIHFGHACLSPSQRLPVLYIFGKAFIDVQDTVAFVNELFPDNQTLILIIYEVVYSHAIGSIVENLTDYQNLVISKLLIPSKDNELTVTGAGNDNEHTITKSHRCFTIPKTNNINDYSVFYIGTHNQTLMNLMLSLNHCKFFSYNPIKKCAQPETLDINRYLKKRYFYIEKAKDANIIGILVGTLGVSNYLTIIKHLKELIKEAGKKSYTLVVGKLNSAKLANFPEIEIFVNVACIESSIIDSHEFYQPIITPYELEISLNQAREWTGDYITDFSELLPGATKHIPPSQIKKFDGDVSLITGKIRTLNDSFSEDQPTNETSALVNRDEMKVSTIHAQAAGEYLSQRSWKGLEQCLGETPVTKIQQGRKGIACKYEDEETNSK